MAYNSFLLQLLLVLTWRILVEAPYKTFVFNKYLPDQPTLQQDLTDMSLRFAPGLLNVLISAVPPKIAYFKKLPSNFKKKWAAYLMVLEKSGRRPKIYVGLGANKRTGVKTRVDQYNRGENLARFVEKAIKDGFAITHIGMLCWIPLPSPDLVPKLRVVMHALETTFAFSLGALYSKTETYGYARNMCLWDIESLEYDGCCSHSPLMEIPVSDFDLSAEELEAKDAFQLARAKEVNTAARLRRKAADPERYAAQQREVQYRIVNRDRKAWNAKRVVWRAKRSPGVRAAKTFRCEPCKKSFTEKNRLDRHLATQKHRKVLAGTYKRCSDTIKQRSTAQNNRVKANRTHYCSVCDHAFQSAAALLKHYQTKRHLDKAGTGSTP